MTAALLALGASLLWGISNFQAGVLSRRYSVFSVLTVTRSSSLLAVIVLVLLVDAPLPQLGNFLVATVAGLLVTAGLAAFYRALAVGTMSIVSPIAASGAAVPVIFGLAAGDRPDPLQLVGVALAFVGAVLAARDRDGVASAGSRTSIALAVVAAAAFGFFFVIIDSAANDGHILWILVAVRIASVPALLVVGRALSIKPLLPRSGLPLMALVGLMELTALGLFVQATTQGLLTLVGMLASLYPVVTVFLATAWLHERISRSQWIGVGTAVVGVALITGG